MRTSRRRLRSAAVLTAATLCASISFTDAAHAAIPSIQLSFDGATNDPVVSGVVDVAATITTDSPLSLLQYRLGVNGTIESVPIPAGCSTTCTVHWNVDTTALTTYETGGQGIPAVPDGHVTLQVRTENNSGIRYAGGTFQVDNHRPSLGTTTLVGAPLVTTADKLDLTVHPTVSATAPAGTTIADVELEAVGSVAWPVSHFTRNADGSWTTVFPKGSLPGGIYAMKAVAVDSNGTVSAPATGEITIDSGFTVTPPPSVVGPDWRNLTLNVSYPGWKGCAATVNTPGPTDVRLQVDGKLWQDSQVSSTGCPIPATGNVTQGADQPLPLGKHTLTWTVTDSAGVSETVNQPVTVALPLTSNWPTGSRTLVAGSTLHVAAKVSAPDGFSTLKSWTISDQQGHVLSSGTGATQPSLNLATPVNQQSGGVLGLTTVSDSGLTSWQSFTYQTGWATSAYAHVSANSVKRGSYVSLYASDWVRVNGVWAFDIPAPARVLYQWETPGSNVWHNSSTVTVSAASPRPGVVRMRVGASGCFRAIYTQTNPYYTEYGSSLIPATSAPVCVTAH